jgi:sugar phosphate isomerase/epimerase
MITDRSRRRFFGTAAAAAAWPLLSRVASAESAATVRLPAPRSTAGKPDTTDVEVASLADVSRGGRLKLGVASYSMREFTLDQALDMARTLGVTHMTFKDVHVPRTDPPDATRALRAKIQAAGITIMGGGTITIPNDPAKIKKEFEYAKNAGFPLIFVDPEPAALDTIEQMAKTYDIKVAIHNHGPEDKRWPRPQDAYAAVKSRDKRLGLCIDIGHTTRTGTDPVQACRECRDRLYDMHVKDLAAKSDKESQVEVGRGVIDFPALFKTLIDIGYQGQVGLEYEIKAKDPLPGMIESMAYMRGVLAAVAT